MLQLNLKWLWKFPGNPVITTQASTAWGCRYFELRSHKLYGMAEEKSNKKTPNLKWLVNIYIITLKFFKKLCRQVQEESQSKYRPDFIQLPTNVVLSFLPWLPLCTTSVDASLRITPQDTNLESSQHQSKKIKLVSSAPLSGKNMLCLQQKFLVLRLKEMSQLDFYVEIRAY